MNIKTISTDLYKSIAVPQFYREVTTRSLGSTTKYFVVLCLLYAGVSATILGVREVPHLREQINKYSEELLAAYPQDLVVTSKDGLITVNRPEPFIVPMPKEFLDNQEKEMGADAKYPQKVTNFIVLDQNGTVGDLEKYQTLFVINSANILHTGTNGVEAQSTKGLPNFELTKEVISNRLNENKGLLSWMPLVVPGVMFVLTFGGFFVFRYLYAVGLGFFVKLITNGRGLKFTYKDSLKIVLHSLTLPTLIDLIFYTFNWYPPLETWFFVINVVFLIIVVKRLETIENSKSLRA